MPVIVRYGNLPLQKLNTASTSIITVRPCRGGFVPEGACNRAVWKPSPCILDIEYAREVEDISQDGEGESEPSL